MKLRCLPTFRCFINYLLGIVANYRQRPDPLPVEAEVLGERLRESNAVPVLHETSDGPSILLRVPRGEALHVKQYQRSSQVFQTCRKALLQISVYSQADCQRCGTGYAATRFRRQHTLLWKQTLHYDALRENARCRATKS